MTRPEGPQPVEAAAAALLRAKAGLCAGCRHAEILRSKRSAFLRCARADRDERYPRYPGLPVLQCGGLETTAVGEPGNRAPDGRSAD